ncbi:HAMP domain-containing protein [bacterium BFN5]|nr:HAMP domain-containing protein [bacterium BFN5]QJW45185.1 HAMP domain-containing protein [bacterium BFN5]
MTWFLNLKIGKKLLTGFISVALIAGIMGSFAAYNLSEITEQDKKLYERYTVPLGDLLDMMESYYTMRVEVRNIILAKDQTEREKAASKVRTELQRFKKSIQTYEATVSSDEGRKISINLKNGVAEYEPYIEKTIQFALNNQTEVVIQLLQTDGLRIGKVIEDALAGAQELKIKTAGEKAVSNQSMARHSIIVVSVFVLASVLIAIALGLFLARMISNPVNKLVEVADKLADGNVNVSVEATTKDELGLLMASFAKMVNNIREQALVVEKIAGGDLTVDVAIRSEQDLLGKKLSEMVATNNKILSNINFGAEEVAAGAQQIAASGEVLSQGSTEQASSIEEITASMTQVAAQTKQNAVNATQANELAAMAKEKALAGNSQMNEMVKAMGEINESSANISKIIKVIDEIAFQTNILALNAAVEAARAGQHGKGFAVVAEEVRNLAARSANAAKETTMMIEGSTKKVDAGAKFANETAAALGGILEEVTKAAAIVGQIAEASNEQAMAIAQINQAIAQVSQVVQTNSATAEESASASEELSGQAEAMKENVRRFKLKQTSMGLAGGDGYSISPEMLRVLEGMTAKKTSATKQDENSRQPAVNSPNKIMLDDRDFGKY